MIGSYNRRRVYAIVRPEIHARTLEQKGMNCGE
jgi:hypothetical protein